MARDHARVNVAIWGDPEFRALPPQAQHLYLMLWTSPGLSYCGVHDWRPARISGLAGGWTRADVEDAAMCLAARHFVVVDEDREEILLRSWLRFDGLMKQPRMAISAVNAYSNVASELIRSVLVSELQRVRETHPNLTAWGDERVLSVLAHPTVSPKGWPTPSDPFGDGVRPRLAQTQGDVSGSVSGSPTPAPATYSSSITPTPSPRKRGSRISDDWMPEESTIASMRSECPDVDLQAEHAVFIDYWIAQPGQKGVKTDWDATWRNWMRRKQGEVVTRRERPTRTESNLSVVAKYAAAENTGLEITS